MIVIPLKAIPNQRFSFIQGGDRWVIELKVAIKSMICSLWINDEVVLLGTRVVAGVPIIPHQRLTRYGNFGILTDNDMEPWWEEFESTQQMVYWND